MMKKIKNVSKISGICSHLTAFRWSLMLYFLIFLTVGYGIYMSYIDYNYKRGLFDSKSWDNEPDFRNILEPKLIEEGYKGFNVILYDNKFYGLAQDEGEFDIRKVENKGYKRLFVGRSVNEVKQLIDVPTDSSTASQ